MNHISKDDHDTMDYFIEIIYQIDKRLFCMIIIICILEAIILAPIYFMAGRWSVWREVGDHMEKVKKHFIHLETEGFYNYRNSKKEGEK